MKERTPPDPTVTVIIPTYNEQAHIEQCLAAVRRQTYQRVIETLVVDGRSADRTRELASRYPQVRVLDNPRRMQAAALNVGLCHARGDVIVRVDGHCVIADDYVERCVHALNSTGAAMVGGAMTPVANGWTPSGIATAMAAPRGRGQARFHQGEARLCTARAYLGAYPTELARSVGGFSEDVGVNEDYEFAIRMRPHGGIYLDVAIRSTYAPRASFSSLARQFYRYGRSRAATVKRHPRSLRPRQLAAPALVLGILSPWRRRVMAVYAAILVFTGLTRLRQGAGEAAALMASLPVMHLCWGVGFVLGLFGSPPHPPAEVMDAEGVGQ